MKLGKLLGLQGKEKINILGSKVMEKVGEIEQERSNILRCLRAGVCPVCANKLSSESYGSYDQFSDHKCSHCGFKQLGEVLY